jgi:hypothetical protein
MIVVFVPHISAYVCFTTSYHYVFHNCTGIENERCKEMRFRKKNLFFPNLSRIATYLCFRNYYKL